MVWTWFWDPAGFGRRLVNTFMVSFGVLMVVLMIAVAPHADGFKTKVNFLFGHSLVIFIANAKKRFYCLLFVSDYMNKQKFAKELDPHGGRC